MNKRQRKKYQKKLDKAFREEFDYCEGCGEELDRENNEYHDTYGTCDQYCYMKVVGMSMGDFI